MSAYPTITGDTGEIALVNGQFFTVDENAPWVSAVLIQDGVIVAVGSDEEVRKAASDRAEIVDLLGAMGMPGIHDAHSHLLFSGIKFQFECRLSPDADMAKVISELENCSCGAHSIDDLGGWVIGGEINPFNFEGGPDRRALDEAFPGRPIFLWDYTVHHGFASTAALDLAGIDESTDDPEHGAIIRRAGTQEPTGELVEQATWPVKRAMPDYREETYAAALKWAVRVCNSFGITSVQEASAGRQVLTALRALEDSGNLTVHVSAHLVWKEEGFGLASADELEELLASPEEWASDHVDTRFVKMWLDGAPLPPHFTESGLGPDGEPDLSRIVIPLDELFERVKEFDASGRSMKIHCAAQGSVRVALDAIEAAREANGSTVIHEVAHCGFVDPADLDRFEELNVVAEMSPAIWHRKEPEFRVLDAGFKFNTLKKAGATVTIGSDWILTPDPNLFPALQGVLERGEESLSLAEALRIMTLEGARVVGRDAVTGSVTVGKSADIIVLDRNLFEVPADQVGQTRVLLTLFEGRPVFQAD